MLLNDLYNYTQERYPPLVTLPLAAVLCGSALTFFSHTRLHFLLVLITVFAGMFIVRLGDDISDIVYDSITHPARYLVRQSASIKPLKITATALLVLITAVNYQSLKSMVLISATTLFYLVFYSCKKKCPVIIHPFFVNSIFFIIPVYVNYTVSLPLKYPAVLTGLYIWLGTVAHDYAHSIESDRELTAGVPSLSASLGARRCAWLALLLYVTDFMCAVTLWHTAELPAVFIIAATLLFAYITYLAVVLIKNANKKNAALFYTRGFLFFIIPLASIWIHRAVLLITGYR